jgi:hypothetical protein
MTNYLKRNTVVIPGPREARSPESIATESPELAQSIGSRIGVMDSGLAAARRSGMTRFPGPDAEERAKVTYSAMTAQRLAAHDRGP